MGAYSRKYITCSYTVVPSLYLRTLEIELFGIKPSTFSRKQFSIHGHTCQGAAVPVPKE